MPQALRLSPASYHSYINKTLIHKLTGKHDFCLSPIRLLSIGYRGEDNNSHDYPLIHGIIKLLYAFVLNTVSDIVAKITFCAFKNIIELEDTKYRKENIAIKMGYELCLMLTSR